MRRLEKFQDALIASGLMDRDQVTLQNFNLKPDIDADGDSMRYVVQRDVVVYIREFIEDLDLLGLIAKLAIKKLWPSPCQAAELVSIEPDVLDSEESVIVIVFTCNDVYHLKPMAAGAESEHVIIEIEGKHYQIIDEMPLDDLPYFAKLQRL